MTDYGLTVWARVANTGRCRKCRQRIIWRVNRKSGRSLPFNGVLAPLHAFIDERNHQPMEVLSRDDLHFTTCARRNDRRPPGAGASAQ